MSGAQPPPPRTWGVRGRPAEQSCQLASPHGVSEPNRFKDSQESRISIPISFSIIREFFHSCFPATVSQLGLTLSVQVNLNGMMQKARLASRSNSKLIWTLLSCHEGRINCAIVPLHQSCSQQGFKLIPHVMLTQQAWKASSLGCNSK